MKNIYILSIFMALMGLMGACNDDVDGVIPSDIDNLTAEACEGGVILRWDVPTDSSYLYVRVDYRHPSTGEKMRRNASVFQDSLLVNGLFAKDGEYTFNVCPVSTTQTQGEVHSVSCTALPVQPTVEKQTKEILLSADNLSTNAQEPTEGPIANLVNGNYTDFFHTAWSTGKPAPHYVDIALPEPVDVFEIVTWYRGGSRGGVAPQFITILASNDGNTWEKIGEILDDGNGPAKDKFTSPVLGNEGKTYSHLRYRVDETVGGNDYFALAEMKINKVWYDIYDPEGIYQPE